MKTERTYYYDSYRKEFTARIEEIVPSENGFKMYFDRTSFFPESGGQPADRGWIEDEPLLEIVDEGERVAHRVARLPEKQEVRCQLDWERRFDHMQQHTGQHILSAAFWRQAGYPTVSFHLGPEICTLDLESDRVGARQLAESEELAQRIIFENRPIRVNLHSSQEALQLGLRHSVEREGELRIVEIEDFDRTACGGTHVSQTGSVGLILIRKAAKEKGLTRVEFVCGGRAVKMAHREHAILDEVARKFSAASSDLPDLVGRQFQQLKAAERREARRLGQLARYEAQQWLAEAHEKSGLKVVRKIFAPEEGSRAKATVRAVVESAKTLALVGVRSEPATLILAQAAGGPHDMGQLIRQVMERFGGKGGGSRDFAQGGGIPAQRLEEVLAFADDLL